MRTWRALAGAVGMVVAGAASVGAQPTSLSRAFEHAYNLEYPEAQAAIEAARAAAPEDAAVARGAATIAWLRILFLRGAITVDEYLGQLTRRDVTLAPPPPELASAFTTAVDRALRSSRERTDRQPDDVQALYELGAAVGLRASYVATVEGRVLGGLGAARRAYNAHERVLALDPTRADAGLIVGTYRYLVASLSLPARWLAYVVGFGGDKDRGLALIEAAAAHPGEAQTDAKFALVLLYNRERRYDDALRILGELASRYPRNRLLWLEQGSTELRAGRTGDAEATLNAGLRHLEADQRERAPSEVALWHYKRGVARRALGRTADALADLERAAGASPHLWVRGRIELERGRLAAEARRPAEASRHFVAAVETCRKANDAPCADEAAAHLDRMR